MIFLLNAITRLDSLFQTAAIRPQVICAMETA
jgi:hypothetical protein